MIILRLSKHMQNNKNVKSDLESRRDKLSRPRDKPQGAQTICVSKFKGFVWEYSQVHI